MVAGGMESMSNAPYLLPKARTGLRLGHAEVKDHMFLDGLEDAYDPGVSWGRMPRTRPRSTATRAKRKTVMRSTRSRARRTQSDRDGSSRRSSKSRAARRMVVDDEQPLKANLERIPQLKPAFRKDGTVTAANSSSISDGAAALVLMTLAEAEQRGVRPLARIVAHATHAQAPAWFTTAPVGAVGKLFDKTGWDARTTTLRDQRSIRGRRDGGDRRPRLTRDRVNVNGGACALGHPLGASGARIMVTLLHALEQHGLKRGIAALCIGGGEATAIAVERLT